MWFIEAISHKRDLGETFFQKNFAASKKNKTSLYCKIFKLVKDIYVMEKCARSLSPAES